MANQLKLQQPVTGGGLQNTNFFNGRLVTGGDMTREQKARREAVSRLGRAVGEGIVEGLRVKIVPNDRNDPIVGISPGRAVNRAGQVLSLSETAVVNLLQRISTVEQESGVFSDCKPLTGGTYAAGFGFYLLVLSPVLTKQGSAPTGGLKNSFAACSSDVILEAVQFRLLPVDPFLSDDVLPNRRRLRNYIAYRCFGTTDLQGFYVNPLGFSSAGYGLLDEMRGKNLSDADVPLAIINWTASGLEFVEMWAVRRRLAKINDSAGWTQLFGDRRESETEAMIEQFADQLREEQPEINDFREIAATDYFYFLPPVGIIPLAGAAIRAGFNLENFFGSGRLEPVGMLEGERLMPLLGEALRHEPVNLGSDEKIQVYVIRENYLAVEAGRVKQITAVFAKRSLPFFGTARFDLSSWDLSRFV